MPDIDLSFLDNDKSTDKTVDLSFLNEPETTTTQKKEPISLKEGFDNVMRSMFQVPLGAAKRVTWPADAFKMLTEANTEATLHELKSPEYGEYDPMIDIEEARKSAQPFIEAMPTQELLEKKIEEKTGLPLRPETPSQNMIRLGSEIYGFKGGGLNSIKSAMKGMSAYTALTAGKVPHGLAEPLAFLFGMFEGTPEGFKLPKEAEVTAPPSAGKPPIQTPPSTGEPPKIDLGKTRGYEDITPVLKQTETEIATVARKGHPDLRTAIGKEISPNKFYNKSQGLSEISKEYTSIANNEWKDVGKKYEKATELQKQVEDFYPGLADAIKNRLKETEGLSLSTPEKKLRRFDKEFLKSIAETSPTGEITGYKPLTLDRLEKQIQSINAERKFNLDTGEKSNYLKVLVGDILEAMEKSAVRKGRTDILEAIKEARSSYADWRNTYDNPIGRSLRSRHITDKEKLYDSISNSPDRLSEINNVLQKSKQGIALSNAAKRSLVEERLQKYSKNPKKIDLGELEADLNQLEVAITPEQRKKIEETIKAEKDIPSLSEEKIDKAFSSREGIKKLRSELKKHGREDVFNLIAHKKIDSLLSGDEVLAREFSNEELYNVLNKRKNFEIVAEVAGQEAANKALREAANKTKTAIAAEEIISNLLKTIPVVGKYTNTLRKAYKGYKRYKEVPKV